MNSDGKTESKFDRLIHGNSIRIRILAGMLAVVLITAIPMIISTLLEGTRKGYWQAISHLESVAVLKEAAIEKWQRNLLIDLHFELNSGGHLEMIRALLGENGDTEQLETFKSNLTKSFRETISMRKRFEELFILDRRGNIVLSTNPNTIGEFRGLQSYFREGLSASGIHVQTLAFSSTSEKLNMIVAVCPIMDREGKSIGVFAGVANFYPLNKIMTDTTGLGNTGENYLVGKNHVLLSELRQTSYPIGTKAIFSRPVVELLGGKRNGHGTYLNHHNVPVIGVWKWLPDIQAGFVVEQDESEVYAYIRKALLLNIGVLAAAVIIATLIAFVISGSISSPIKSLAATASRIASGELELETKINRKDEIGQLAEAFNSMTCQLRNLISGLEKKIMEQNRTYEALRKSESLYHDLVETSQNLIWQCDDQGRFKYVNPAWKDALGYSSDEMIGKSFFEFQPPEYAAKDCIQFDKLRSGGKIRGHETCMLRKDKREITLVINANPIKDSDGKVCGIRGTAFDITETKRLQAQLQQNIKMESIGRLAGGIAHDFNNMLNVILGATEIALEEMPKNSQARVYLEEIAGAAHRAANLTQQLLAFARRQIFSPRVINLNETIDNMLVMLKRLISENIKLEWIPQPELWNVKMDPSQFDQMLTNLMINSRDSISGNGTITIKTANCVFDEKECEDRPGATPGNYVLVSVSDTGCGMDSETLSRIFEPFFSKKEFGQGTGLGLATVYGIVKQNGGFISVSSEPSHGTTIEVYIPKTDEKPETKTIAPPAPEKIIHAKILLVEDDPIVLQQNKKLLEKMGHMVLAFSTPEEALKIDDTTLQNIDLLVTDIVLPSMDGNKLSQLLKKRKPELKVLFTSGYTTDYIADHKLVEPDIHFLQKPFTSSKLSQAIQKVFFHCC